LQYERFHLRQFALLSRLADVCESPHYAVIFSMLYFCSLTTSNHGAMVMTNSRMHWIPTFETLTSHRVIWRIFVVSALLLATISVAFAGPPEQAQRIHGLGDTANLDRLTAFQQIVNGTIIQP
jgi:hypothetical protein